MQSLWKNTHGNGMQCFRNRLLFSMTALTASPWQIKKGSIELNKIKWTTLNSTTVKFKAHLKIMLNIYSLDFCAHLFEVCQNIKVNLESFFFLHQYIYIFLHWVPISLKSQFWHLDLIFWDKSYTTCCYLWGAVFLEPSSASGVFSTFLQPSSILKS